jgi:hypothetical protein
MLLGCCHCGEEPPSESESVPPSESISVSENIPVIVTGCGDACLDATVPLIYQINVVRDGTPTIEGHELYEGVFALFYISPFCYRFDSAERGSADGPRWRLNIGGSSAGTGFGLQALTSFGAVVTYELAVAPGNINCVQSFTLVRTLMTSGWKFPSTLGITPV